MGDKPETLMVDDVLYVRADRSATNKEGYSVVRTSTAGVHIGFVEEFGTKYHHHQYAKLTSARRLHYWEGACSLSQVAMDGVNESKSRISVAVPVIELTDVIEVIPCSDKAARFFQTAKEWKSE